MSISSSDILFKYSVTTGSAGNQNPQTVPNNSLGKYISTTQWTGGTLHDLFDLVTGLENAASQVDYRCIFVHNNHGTLTLSNAVVWISAQVAGGATIAIGIDTNGVSGISSSSAQAVTVGSTTTAPAGVTFSNPTTEGAALALGDLLPATCRAVWIQRTAANTSALINDGATLSVSGDSL